LIFITNIKSFCFSTQKGRSASYIAGKLGYGNDALGVEYDDNNVAWEDIQEENEYLEEMRWQNDDAAFFGVSAIPSKEAATRAKEAVDYLVRSTNSNTDIIFRGWWCFWKEQIARYKSKEEWLDANAPYKPPHKFFTLKERSAFKTLLAAGELAIDGDTNWYQLPGPADWWSDDYDYAVNGFDIEPVQKVQDGRALAWEILKENKQPVDWEKMVFGDSECIVFRAMTTFEDFMEVE
jgi:hypothetical protein